MLNYFDQLVFLESEFKLKPSPLIFFEKSLNFSTVELKGLTVTNKQNENLYFCHRQCLFNIDVIVTYHL